MVQKKKLKGYYTAGEVKKILGITDGMLYNYVRYGHLERVIPPGKKQGVYKREEVEKLELELKAFLASSTESKRTSFSKVTPEDVSETVRLSQEIFGKDTGITVETRLEWVKRNSDVSYQLCIDGDVIGCATLLPLQPERIEAILRGEVNSEETTADEIAVYEPGQTYHLYAMGVGITPTVTKTEKRIYGGKLVRGIGEALADLGRRGIEIETITARSQTIDGIRLLRHIGFTRIPSITKNVNYVMNINEANVPFLRHYKEELQLAKEQLAKQKT